MTVCYEKFLQQKVCVAPTYGFEVLPEAVSDRMKPHCRAIVPWLLSGGRRALFASFGLHKTVIQLEAVRLAAEHAGGRGLITIPLGVRQEFRRDAVERLGWTEQCKDGSRQGAGMPEYLLLFRKPPTDRSNGYADLPVVKDKETYTRPRWQFDAHGYMKSSGNRPLVPGDLDGLDQAAIFQMFKRHSLQNVYDFRHDVKIAEHVDKSGWLPSTFMLLQPQSWHPDVWTDITRMLTLNSTQAAKGREQHICPLQFDIVDRAIEQYTMPGEVVYDPFAGIGTSPYRAIKLGRYGRGCELSPPYFLDMAAYCAAASREMEMPDLFALLDAEQQDGAA